MLGKIILYAAIIFWVIAIIVMNHREAVRNGEDFFMTVMFFFAFLGICYVVFKKASNGSL